MLTNTYSVYILASGRNGTLYVGVTNNHNQHKKQQKQTIQRFGIAKLARKLVHDRRTRRTTVSRSTSAV